MKMYTSEKQTVYKKTIESRKFNEENF